jgi:hypothetical protein
MWVRAGQLELMVGPLRLEFALVVVDSEMRVW